jgi:hypothetical protein
MRINSVGILEAHSQAVYESDLLSRPDLASNTICSGISYTTGSSKRGLLEAMQEHYMHGFKCSVANASESERDMLSWI